MYISLPVFCTFAWGEIIIILNDTIILSQSPFELLAQKMDDLYGDGGLLKEVVQAGDGPLVPEDSSILCMFKCILCLYPLSYLLCTYLI